MPRKKKKHEEEQDDGGDTFTVMFTALSIIILAFFILLKSMSADDEKKRKIAIGSLFGTFGILPGGENFDKKGKFYSKLIPLIKTSTIFEGLSKEKEYLESKGYISGVDLNVERTADGVKITIKSPVLFNKNSYSIDPRIFPVLDRLAGILIQVNNKVEIVGHVSKPKKQGFISTANWELSLGRAVSIANYFIEADGLPSYMFKTVGRGFYPYKQGHDIKIPKGDYVIIYIKASKRIFKNKTDIPSIKPSLKPNLKPKAFKESPRK